MQEPFTTTTTTTTTSLFDYKEHGVVDAIVPTQIRRGLPVRPTTAVRVTAPGGRTGGSPDLHFLRRPLPAPDRRMARCRTCWTTSWGAEGGINNKDMWVVEPCRVRDERRGLLRCSRPATRDRILPMFRETTCTRCDSKTDTISPALPYVLYAGRLAHNINRARVPSTEQTQKRKDTGRRDIPPRTQCICAPQPLG